MLNENDVPVNDAVEAPTTEALKDLNEVVEAVNSAETVSPAKNVELLREVFGAENENLVTYLDTLNLDIPETYFSEENKNVLPFFIVVKLAPSVVSKVGKARGSRLLAYLNLINQDETLYRHKALMTMVLIDLVVTLSAE